MRKVWKLLQKKAEGTVYEGTSKHLMDELMEREDRSGITMEYLHAVGQFHVVEELPVDARCPLAAACSLQANGGLLVQGPSHLAHLHMWGL
jgi:hypothetical protein